MLQKSQIRYRTKKHPQLIRHCGSGSHAAEGVSCIAGSCFPGCAENSELEWTWHMHMAWPTGDTSVDTRSNRLV